MKTKFINWLKTNLPGQNGFRSCRYSAREMKKILNSLENGDEVKIRIYSHNTAGGIQKKYFIEKIG